MAGQARHDKDAILTHSRKRRDFESTSPVVFSRSAAVFFGTGGIWGAVGTGKNAFSQTLLKLKAKICKHSNVSF